MTTRNPFSYIDFNETDGVVSLAFSDLLKSMWRKKQDKVKSVRPFKFKKHFGEINEQFKEPTQEDAH